MLAFKNHFSLSDTTEMCESIIPDLPMDFAMFVVHAIEDRFSGESTKTARGFTELY